MLYIRWLLILKIVLLTLLDLLHSLFVSQRGGDVLKFFLEVLVVGFSFLCSFILVVFVWSWLGWSLFFSFLNILWFVLGCFLYGCLNSWLICPVFIMKCCSDIIRRRGSVDAKMRRQKPKLHWERLTDAETNVSKSVVRDTLWKALPTREWDDVDKGLLWTHYLSTWSTHQQ